MGITVAVTVEKEWVDLSDAARNVELNSLCAALQAAVSGRAGCTVVDAPAGSGKTWLLERFGEIAGDRALVLRTAGHPDESSLPYAALHRLILPLLDARTRLTPARREAVERALSLAGGPPADGSPADSFATAAGVLDLVVERAAVEPVVALVDDAHLLDEATRRVITFVSHRLDADAVLFVVAARPTEESSPVPLGARRLPLDPLSRAHGAAVVREHHPGIAQHVVDRIVAESAGLPLALTQLAAPLTDRQREGHDPLPALLGLPESLARAYRTPIRGLAADARLALAIAALGDLDAAELTVALAAAGLGAEVLAPVEAAGLVTVRPDGVGLSHPTVRTAVIEELPFAVRLKARDAILDALPPGSPRAAEHLAVLHSGPDEAVAAAYDDVGRDAWARGACSEAGWAWATAADRSTTAPAARHRRDRAANAMLNAGNMRAAAQLLRSLLKDASSHDERISLLHRLVYATYLDDDPLAVDSVEHEAAALLEDGPAAASLFGPLMLAHVTYGDYRRVVAIADRVRAATGDAELSPAMHVYCDVADVLAARPGSGRLLLSDWGDSFGDRQLLPPQLLISPTLTVMAMAGAADRALRIADRALAAGSEPPRPSTQILLRGGRAYVLVAVGRWPEAHSECSAAIDLAAASDLSRLGGYLRLLRAQLAAATGRTEEMEADLAATTMLPEKRRSVAEPLTRGQHELAQGNAAMAAEHFATARRAAAACGLVEPSFVPMLADHVEALWLLDRAGDLADDLDAFERRAAELGRLGAQALAARCRAMTAETGEFDALFARADGLHPRSDLFERARTQLAWGRRLRREQRLGAARGPLVAARDLFARLGARPWHRTAVAELKACGVGADDIVADVGAVALTAREREVATAAAAGHTNADIAVRLFVSRRTVEYHLANAFTKLGVNRRGELGRLLSPGG